MEVISIACNAENVFVNWHPMLVRLVMWIVRFTGEVVITSARRYRKIHKKDSGIHIGGSSEKDPLRAIDIRYYIYGNPQGLCDIINTQFLYDPKRPRLKCAILHSPLPKQKHIHLQVHDRTITNGELGKAVKSDSGNVG